METKTNTKKPNVMNVQARWSGCRYVAQPDQTDGRVWWSYDGDIWYDRQGLYVEGEMFDGARITLSGGPRNGEIVA